MEIFFHYIHENVVLFNFFWTFSRLKVMLILKLRYIWIGKTRIYCISECVFIKDIWEKMFINSDFIWWVLSGVKLLPAVVILIFSWQLYHWYFSSDHTGDFHHCGGWDQLHEDRLAGCDEGDPRTGPAVLRQGSRLYCSWLQHYSKQTQVR